MFFILGNFLPFYLTSSPKSENFKTMKKTPGDIIILDICTKNLDHMLYCPWGMARDTCNCCFSFWAIFYLLPPIPKKQNLKRIKRNTLRYHNFTHAYQKLYDVRLDDVRFVRYGGRQMDRQKKWHIEVGAPPKNFITLKYQVITYYKNLITSNLYDIGPKAFSERN